MFVQQETMPATMKTTVNLNSTEKHSVYYVLYTLYMIVEDHTNIVLLRYYIIRGTGDII